jgi:hypothetical protein
MAKADRPFEYVLSYDSRFGDFSGITAERPGFVWIENDGRKCAVDSWNNAAKHSTGRVLILTGDDNFPCPHWDTELAKILPADLDSEFVIAVSTGNPRCDAGGDLITQIQSRSRYERLGYMFCPEYESMYGDDEFSAHARLDNCVIDARHLMFPEHHPVLGNAEMDAVYAWTNRPELYKRGRETFLRRQAEGFGTKLRALPKKGGTIAVCLPGEWFPQVWVDGLVKLLFALTERFDRVRPCWADSSNVSMTREVCLEMVNSFEDAGETDWVLWLDDDNLLSPEQFDQLFSALQGNPDLDGVVGWCWIMPTGRISCGRMDERGSAVSYEYGDLMAGPENLKPIEWSGFPCVLHRYELIAKAGQFPFRPILDDRYRFGQSGEDIAFFEKARAAGAKFAVERRVKLPHLKLGAPEPDTMRKVYEPSRAGVA